MLWLSAVASALLAAKASKPNLIYILMDDTDLLLGSPEAALPKTRRLIGDAGATFTHFLTHSPKCTPSRTGQLVGRHYHNVRPDGWKTAKFGGGLNQTTLFEPTALFPLLHSQGYLTSIVGKVHNGQGKWLCQKKTNKTNTACFSHVSTQCRPCGNYWGNQYVEKDIGDDTTHMAEDLPPNDWSTYSHGQFGNRSLAFMKAAVKAGKPFFAHIGTTGPHLPSIPAPWHAETVRRWNDSVFAPRSKSFNAESKDAPPFVEALPFIDDDKVQYLDQHYRDRLGTLLSIDDLVENIVNGLDDLGVLDNTYMFVSADHGYHIGNYKLPMEKMWHWETDVRIPFWMRGPSIPGGQVLDVMGLNIDITPTLLDLAGLLHPHNAGDYDGRTLLPLVTGSDDIRKVAAEGWRTRTVIAFAEGYTQTWGKVTLSSIGNAQGAPVDPPSMTIHPPATSEDGNNTYLFDVPENQWRALRVANATHNTTFVQWDPSFHFMPDTVSFTALYDLNAEPDMMVNVWGQTPATVQEAWKAELDTLFTCAGATCP